jgi:hypothetical protein
MYQKYERKLYWLFYYAYYRHHGISDLKTINNIL